jgi:pimeloyl-ACP methyl ester carboxylesterase
VYQNYADPDFLINNVQDVFLPLDIAVLYTNKRGMGESEGNWMHNDFQGRADDVYAAVRFLKQHSVIDPSRIGLIGHSQGGWIVTLTAAQHEDVAYFISLAGPTTTVFEQMEANDGNLLRCQGYEGVELRDRLQRQLRISRFGAALGRFIRIGEIRFMSGIIDYDPRQSLRSVNVPGLLVFGEMDPIVPPDQNLERLDEVFGGDVPDNLTTAVIADSQHLFRLVDTECTIYQDFLSGTPSDELVQVLQEWLTGR